MSKIHPQVAHVSPLSHTFTTSKQESFTIWMKSLILRGKGCTVFDSNGQIVYRVDNYHCKSSNEAYLMDITGKVLFTIRRKKFRLIRFWEGLRSFNGRVNDEDKNPGFEIESCRDKSTFKIVDKLGRFITEVKRKQSKCGISFGEDVLTMVVEPHIDHSLIMGLVVAYGLINGLIQQHQNDGVAPNSESVLSSPSMADSAINPKSNVTVYYHAHHAVVTSDWLAQAQEAVGRHTDYGDSLGSDGRAAPIGGKGEGSGKAFSVIDEFNSWRKQSIFFQRTGL
ncbi:Phosphatidylinositol-4-phosphate 5-kinase family protein, putative isoform 1 [Hibiscus syriacus]|uniref:Phosphatidylinositol-4-phosphate 5-kinase family protein, putative isoform 1 n=1 Tax=Hibiscus syriacus TaxID=106335 RepID=A0A6A3BH45_HIBSY|nr:Phosphatidylinositol-4-phosphate 5-kinase family protein, putative isoform 1 [Hibiscus syriacus]